MRFQILGPIRVSGQDREVSVTAGREQALLATLLLNANRTVPMSRLVDALWPDSASRDARGRLHGCVSRLRKHLAYGEVPEQVVVTDPAGYRVDVTGATVDLMEFRELVDEARVAAGGGDPGKARDRYRTALALWRGPALAGVDSHSVQQAAARLDEERAQTLEECIRVELALGGGGALVGELAALAIMREAGFRQGECAVYNEFGDTLRAAGDSAGALEQHQQALDGATKINHKYGQARALDGIAACLRNTDPEAARRHWLRALQLYQELDVPERHDVESALADLTVRPAGARA